MDAVAGGGFDGAGGGLDVFALGAGEGGDDVARGPRGRWYGRRRVALRGDGEAGLEDVDAEGRDLMGHAEFFVVMHGAAGGLLAVAEGGVEEDDLVRLRAWEMLPSIWTIS